MPNIGIRRLKQLLLRLQNYTDIVLLTESPKLKDIENKVKFALKQGLMYEETHIGTFETNPPIN
jgi:hypothetical protein